MHLLDRYSRRMILAGAGAAILALGLVAWLALGLVSSHKPLPSPTASPSQAPSTSPTPSPSPSPVPSPSAAAGVPCPLNGLPADDAAAVERVALAVQVENNPVARPARNLSNADMVVEVPVEGDTTRFSAIFLCRATVGLTGPVRSARYYEVDLWQDLHVLPIGFGGSPPSLQRFANAGMPYVNGITGSWPDFFHRAGAKPAPHNLFGDIEALRAAVGAQPRLDQLVAAVGKLRPQFTFDPLVALPAGRSVQAFEIHTSPSWRFGWSWIARSGTWTRQDAGVVVTDEVTGSPLTAAHVVVQRVTQEVVYGDPDPGGNPRRLQHFVGKGDGTLYSGGQAFALHWSRPTAADGTTWTYADGGKPVVLPPGVVWWEVIPVGAPLTES